MKLNSTIHIIFAEVVVLMLSGCKDTDCIPETIVRDSIRVEYKHDNTYTYQHNTIYQDNKVVEVKNLTIN